MSPDYANRVTSLPLFPDRESNDGRAISSEVVFATGLQRRCPRIALLQIGVCQSSLHSGIFNYAVCRIDMVYFYANGGIYEGLGG